MEGKKILLVEDDPNFGAVLKDYLMINDFDVTLAKNGMEGFEKFKSDNFDLSKIVGPFSIATEGKFTVSITNIRLEKLPEGDKGCVEQP